jgi:NAD(P)-dependent dehydrogenase (short-subunit alcohol dehydrogenase family)
VELKSIEEQVVAVVGASSGIGRETARRFAERGARIVVSARSEEGLQSLVQEIQRRGGQAAAIAADVADFAQVQAIAERAVGAYGRLDTWVHLAAVALYATFEQTTPEEFRRVIEVNLLGQVYGAMAALPHLKREGRGALIHVSSVEAKRAFPYHSAYAASKHGIDGWLEAMRLELEHDGVPVSVTQILPASINTPLFSTARTKLGVKPKGAPPIYQPELVADAILHAAEHPMRDIVVGGAGMAMLATQRLSPRLMDAMLLRGGFEIQKTDEPKSEAAPNNLFTPVGDNRVEGDFSDMASERSYATWLELSAAGRRGALAGAALGTAALLARRTLRRRGLRGNGVADLPIPSK